MLAETYTLKGIWAAIIAGVIALLLALNIAQAVNTYADIRIPLPFGLHIGWEGWKPKAERLAGEIKAAKKASDENAVAQQAANTKQKQSFDSSAETTNVQYPKVLADNRSAADRYKSLHRVQPGTPSVSPGSTAPQADPAKPAEIAPAGTELVTITGSDIDACTVDYTYAQSVYDWAQDLVSKGTAEFKP